MKSFASIDPPDEFLNDVYSCTEGIRELSGLQDGFVLPLFRRHGENEAQLYTQLLTSDENFIDEFISESFDHDVDDVIPLAGPTDVRPGSAAIYGFYSQRHGAFCGNRRQVLNFLERIQHSYDGTNPFLFYDIMAFADDKEGIDYAATQIRRLNKGAISEERLIRDYPGAKNPILKSSGDNKLRRAEALIGPSVVDVPIDKILVGDCLRVLQSLSTESIDMVFADPPQSLGPHGDGLRFGPSGTNEDRKESSASSEYDDFTRAWLSEVRRVLKRDGTLWVMGSYHNIFRIGTALQDLEFWLLNDIVWRKTNPVPNFRGRRFTNAHETIIWAARNRDSRHKFNYESMKALNEDVQMRSDWLLPTVAGTERISVDGRRGHPTQKPESLLFRAIMAATEPGDLILDPFFGTGTTGAVAKRLGRHFIGIEGDASYAKLAETRISNVQALSEIDAPIAPYKRVEARIPFGALVENGLLQPGALLTDFSGRSSARVAADGTIVTRDATGTEYRGSIHQVGAAVQKAPACNGWTFWHVALDGQRVPIDELRRKLSTSRER